MKLGKRCIYSLEGFPMANAIKIEKIIIVLTVDIRYLVYEEWMDVNLSFFTEFLHVLIVWCFK